MQYLIFYLVEKFNNPDLTKAFQNKIFYSSLIFLQTILNDFAVEPYISEKKEKYNL
jgi:hypothetical protein